MVTRPYSLSAYPQARQLPRVAAARAVDGRILAALRRGGPPQVGCRTLPCCTRPGGGRGRTAAGAGGGGGLRHAHRCAVRVQRAPRPPATDYLCEHLCVALQNNGALALPVVSASHTPITPAPVRPCRLLCAPATCHRLPVLPQWSSHPTCQPLARLLVLPGFGAAHLPEPHAAPSIAC